VIPLSRYQTSIRIRVGMMAYKPDAALVRKLRTMKATSPMRIVEAQSKLEMLRLENTTES